MRKLSFVRAGCPVVCTATLLLCLHHGKISAQTTDPSTPEPVEVLDIQDTATAVPLDDITERSTLATRQTLPYSPVREADIAWEQRVWRVIDVREKINHPFIAPNSALFQILTQAALEGQLRVYSTETDRFTKPLRNQELQALLYSTDTIMTLTGESMTEEKLQVVHNEMNWENIKRFRIKEVWYFDKNTSTLQVRILGIAPLVDEVDEHGNFKYERPLFWVHYPSARPLLARHKAIMHHDNDASAFSWEDLFESRRFSSTIYKQTNVHDRRISEYANGTDMLQEAEKCKNELFAWEHDLWSY